WSGRTLSAGDRHGYRGGGDLSVLPTLRSTTRTALQLFAALGLLAGLNFLGAERAGAEPAALANDMIARVNQVRAVSGLPPLSEAAELDALASERSADMVGRHYF